MPQPSTDIEVDPQRRHFGCRESDFALQRLVEYRWLLFLQEQIKSIIIIIALAFVRVEQSMATPRNQGS
jgi:hypothetical protein